MAHEAVKTVILHGFSPEQALALMRTVKAAWPDPGEIAFAMSTPNSVEMKLKDVLEELAEDLRLNRADPDAARDSLLSTMACKSAIKAGMHTDPAELLD